MLTGSKILVQMFWAKMFAVFFRFSMPCDLLEDFDSLEHVQNFVPYLLVIILVQKYWFERNVGCCWWYCSDVINQCHCVNLMVFVDNFDVFFLVYTVPNECACVCVGDLRREWKSISWSCEAWIFGGNTMALVCLKKSYRSQRYSRYLCKRRFWLSVSAVTSVAL